MALNHACEHFPILATESSKKLQVEPCIFALCCPCAGHEGVWWSVTIAPLSLNLSTRCESNQFHTPVALTPRSSPRRGEALLVPIEWQGSVGLHDL
jgi:hypothetical protein